MSKQMKVMLGRCVGLFVCVVAVSALLAAQGKQNITGKWDVSRFSESGVSYNLFTFDFHAAGDTAFTGTITLAGQKNDPNNAKTIPISNGKIDGDKVSFDVAGFTRDASPGTIVFAGTYTGVLNGDELKFDISSDKSPRKYTAKRKSAE